MSLASVLSVYVMINLLIAIAAVLTAVLFTMNQQWRLMPYRYLLRWQYAMLVLIVVAASARLLWPAPALERPAAQIWSAPSMRAFTANQDQVEKPLGVSVLSEAQAVPSHVERQVWWGLVAFFVGALLLKTMQAWRCLRALRRGAHTIRRHHRVHILVSDHVQVPCTYWRPGRRIVVMPQFMLTHMTYYRAALAHELQHHRQGDAKAAYAMMTIKALCFWNPCLYWWMRELADIQEYACDEALVDKGRVSSKTYADCLLWVAITATGTATRLDCAPGLTLVTKRHTLVRRIKIMLLSNTNQRSPKLRYAGLVLATTSFLLLGGAALASRGLVEDRRISWDEAKTMLSDIEADPEFPLPLNEAVLAQLNRYLGTPEGRAFVSKALARKKAYDKLLAEKFREYNMPDDLAAIPLTESGYDNLPPSSAHGVGAGLWMFISQTARRYGLIVDKAHDERLDERKETDAAMRYLRDLKARFGTWELAILAYNMGEYGVSRAIAQEGTRDAWRLIAAGHQNDKNYLASVIATAIILRHPQALSSLRE